MNEAVAHVGPEGGPVPPDVEWAIRRARGRGQPLERALQEEMSLRIGDDFNDVRVHTGPEADQLNQRLGARAFTTGPDIFFERGAYDPGTLGGRRRIAHELVHVVQQRTGQVTAEDGCMTVRPADDPFEQQAAQTAERIIGPASPGQPILAPAALVLPWASLRKTPVERTPRQASNHLSTPMTADPRTATIQRTAADFAKAAKNAPDKPNKKNLLPTPMTCHLAVFGWLVRAEKGKLSYPWQFTGVARQTYDIALLHPNASHVFEQWMLDHLYGHGVGSVPLDRPAGAWNTTFHVGDVLYTMTVNNLLQHSMVVTRTTATGAWIHAFNNQATFGTVYSAPAYKYDPFERNINDPRLWHTAGGRTWFGHKMDAQPAQVTAQIYCVRYATLSGNLDLSHWAHHRVGLGWRHDDVQHTVPCINHCPRGTKALEWKRADGVLS